jgi:phosphoribosylanthranilate isomerase
MFVKICGITNLEDGLAAAGAGARALGFIFYAKSPRGVTADQVEAFAHDLPKDVWRVGVFVDEEPETIRAIADRVGLDIAQLHGAEMPVQHPQGLRIWKAFRVRNGLVPNPDYPAEAVLLDGPGSGQTFDWSVASRVSRPVVLSGGLTPENVRAAIAATSPWGVDICSGIESSPGRKDHKRMNQFIEAALRS